MVTNGSKRATTFRFLHIFVEADVLPVALHQIRMQRSLPQNVVAYLCAAIFSVYCLQHIWTFLNRLEHPEVREIAEAGKELRMFEELNSDISEGVWWKA
jgi:hypothetical protein